MTRSLPREDPEVYKHSIHHWLDPPGALPVQVWAHNGFPVYGPDGWVEYRTADEKQERYYFNSHTRATQW